jgi:hypothetical protein
MIGGMNAIHLVYPMAAMVLLAAVVLVRLYRARVAAVRAGLIEIGYFRNYLGAREPEASFRYSRHFTNLFETPVLFYAGCLAAMVAGVATTAMVALAWVYVAVRIAHAIIHLGPNRLRLRRNAYALGWLVLLAIWGHLTVSVALRG